MKVKTQFFGTIEADELSLSRLAGVLEDAAAYNLEKHYIKVHGDLVEESKLIRSALNGQKPHRRVSTATQKERSKRTAKTAGSKKQTGVYKESDQKG